jgi:hypothetical protein
MHQFVLVLAVVLVAGCSRGPDCHHINIKYTPTDEWMNVSMQCACLDDGLGGRDCVDPKDESPQRREQRETIEAARRVQQQNREHQAEKQTQEAYQAGFAARDAERQREYKNCLRRTPKKDQAAVCESLKP